MRSILTLSTILLAVICFNSESAAQSLIHENSEKVFEVVEDPPIPWLYKTKCIEVDYMKKQDCYMQELGIWLAGNLEYPSKALREETEGMVVVQFIIDRSGAIRDAVILKDIGHGCGDAALAVIEQMPNWIPGRQRGEPVNVRYSLPVKFKLDSR